MDRIRAEATRMFAEAGQAGAAVARQIAEPERMADLGARLRALAPQAAITGARGSSDHAATFAKYLIETRTGVPTSSAAPSVSSIYGTPAKVDGALFVAISQSGRSPDLLSAVRAARDGGAFVLALVNDASSPLAEAADEVAPLCAGPEISVAATKSYIAALTAIVGLVSAWTEDEELATALRAAPALLERSWALNWSPLVAALRPAGNLYVIGRGLGLAVAQEAALKLKETCGLHAEAFSAAEVRHGPMALVKPGFPVLVFRQRDESMAGVDALIADLAERGANVLVAGSETSPAVTGAAVKGVTRLPVVDAHPVIEPALQIQSFYRAANALSVARGFDPDRPLHLAKVTETV